LGTSMEIKKWVWQVVIDLATPISTLTGQFIQSFLMSSQKEMADTG